MEQSPNGDLKLGQGQRWWANIKITMSQGLVFRGLGRYHCIHIIRGLWRDKMYHSRQRSAPLATDIYITMRPVLCIITKSRYQIYHDFKTASRYDRCLATPNILYLNWAQSLGRVLKSTTFVQLPCQTSDPTGI